jgi:hypothetical protein
LATVPMAWPALWAPPVTAPLALWAPSATLSRAATTGRLLAREDVRFAEDERLPPLDERERDLGADPFPAERAPDCLLDDFDRCDDFGLLWAILTPP